MLKKIDDYFSLVPWNAGLKNQINEAVEWNILRTCYKHSVFLNFILTINSPILRGFLPESVGQKDGSDASSRVDHLEKKQRVVALFDDVPQSARRGATPTDYCAVPKEKCFPGENALVHSTVYSHTVIFYGMFEAWVRYTGQPIVTRAHYIGGDRQSRL